VFLTQPSDESLALEAAKVVRGLSGGVGSAEELAGASGKLAVREALDEVAEAHERRENSDYPRVTESETGRIETVLGLGRSGHTLKRDHVRSRHRVLRFGVA
jgi:hypothetical protein